MTRSGRIAKFVLLTAVALALIGPAPGAADVTPDPLPVTKLSTSSPELNITSPADGAHLDDERFTLTYEVANFTLNGSAIGGANRAGEGHVHVTVDGIEIAVTANKSVEVSHLKPGKRSIKVALYNNDHTPLDPEVHDEIHVEVPGPHLAVGHPSAGASVNTFEVEVEFHVEHFVLGPPQAANADGAGHIRWRVLKDGVPVTGDPEMLWKTTHTHAELKAPGCTFASCDYKLEAWLANHDGSMVAGTEKVEVSFTVLAPDFVPVLAFGFTMLALIGVAMVWALRRRPGEAPPRAKEADEVEGLSGKS